MADLMQFISSVVWLALAVIVFLCLRQWNKRFSALYAELKQQTRDEEPNVLDIRPGSTFHIRFDEGAIYGTVKLGRETYKAYIGEMEVTRPITMGGKQPDAKRMITVIEV